MKANKFIKDFGLDEAKNILNGRRSWTDKKSGNKLTDNSFVIKSKTYEYAIGTLYMGNFSNYNENSYRCGEVNLLLLNRLVESHEFVSAHTSVEVAKQYCDLHDPNHTSKHYNSLRRKISDVESCQ